MHYSTVFDAAHQPVDWTPLLAGFLVIVLGVAIAWHPKAFVGGLNDLLHRPLYRWSFLVLGLLWTAFALVKLPSDAQVARRNAVSSGCVVTEGRVENFHPMPREGHDMESFTVNGLEFHYSDYVIDGAFNNAASHGGPIRTGLPVRICHRDGRILKLEVAR